MLRDSPGLGVLHCVGGSNVSPSWIAGHVRAVNDEKGGRGPSFISLWTDYGP